MQPLTLAEFRALYPEFVNVPDAIVQRYLTEFTILYRGCYGDYYQTMQGYYVSHMLTTFYNLTTGAPKGGAVTVVTTGRNVGDVSTSGQAIGINTSDPNFWDGTNHGQLFYTLLSLFGAGPMLTGVNTGYDC